MVGAEGFEPPTLCSQSRSDSLLESVEIEGSQVHLIAILSSHVSIPVDP